MKDVGNRPFGQNRGVTANPNATPVGQVKPVGGDGAVPFLGGVGARAFEWNGGPGLAFPPEVSADIELPWQCSVGELSSFVVPNSRLYKTPLDFTSSLTVGGYDIVNGTDLGPPTAGDLFAIKLTLNASVEVTAANLVRVAPASITNQYYELAGTSPDYISAQWLPIAVVISEGDGVGVVQLVNSHIQLVLTSIDGYGGYINV